MPNPVYLGMSGTEGGSGGGMTSSEGGAESSSSSAAIGTGDGDGTTTSTDGLPTSADASSSEGGSGELGEACPDDDTLSLCLLFDVDDPTGVVDESSYANPVTIDGGSLIDSPWTRAFSFDVTTQFAVDCPEACVGGEQVSFEAWLWLEESPDGRSGIVDQNGLLGAFVTEEMALRCNSQGGAAEGGTVPLRAWVHVACVADGEVLLAYIDAELVDEREINPLTPVGQPQLAIGNDSPSFGEPLLGALDRVRVWNRALSPAQVAQAATP